VLTNFRRVLTNFRLVFQKGATVFKTEGEPGAAEKPARLAKVAVIT
jgi:hypothetical protein